MSHPKKSRTIRLILTAALGGAAYVVPSTPAQAAEVKVTILEGKPDDASTWKFEPTDITVAAGTTVAWVWKATDKHSATADDGSWDSGVKQGTGTIWKRKFPAAGTFNYSCTPHPYMYGSVTVN